MEHVGLASNWKLRVLSRSLGDNAGVYTWRGDQQDIIPGTKQGERVGRVIYPQALELRLRLYPREPLNAFIGTPPHTELLRHGSARVCLLLDLNPAATRIACPLGAFGAADNLYAYVFTDANVMAPVQPEKQTQFVLLHDQVIDFPAPTIGWAFPSTDAGITKLGGVYHTTTVRYEGPFAEIRYGPAEAGVPPQEDLTSANYIWVVFTVNTQTEIETYSYMSYDS